MAEYLIHPYTKPKLIIIYCYSTEIFNPNSITLLVITIREYFFTIAPKSYVHLRKHAPKTYQSTLNGFFFVFYALKRLQRDLIPPQYYQGVFYPNTIRVKSSRNLDTLCKNDFQSNQIIISVYIFYCGLNLHNIFDIRVTNQQNLFQYRKLVGSKTLLSL